MMDRLPSGTVTFLFTDIEDSTRLWQEQPEAMSHAHVLHDRILHEAIEANHGYVFRVVGDSFSVAFHNAQDALVATLTAQRELQTGQKDSALQVKARMGLHTGSAEIQTDGKYEGYVTLASTQRVMSAAHGGQVLISYPTADLLEYRPKIVLSWLSIVKVVFLYLLHIVVISQCMRTYLILKEKASQWNADQEIQSLVAEINAEDPAMNLFFGKYSTEKANAVKSHAFDRSGIAGRGLKYEKLDQLTNGLLLGVC